MIGYQDPTPAVTEYDTRTGIVTTTLPWGSKEEIHVRRQLNHETVLLSAVLTELADLGYKITAPASVESIYGQLTLGTE